MPHLRAAKQSEENFQAGLAAGSAKPDRRRKNYAKLTCSACRPFGPRLTTKVTRAPSSKVR
jgi:hypothetical protein